MELQPEFERVVAAVAPGGRLVGFEELTGGSSATVYALDLVSAAGEARRVVFRKYPELDFKGHDSNSVAIEFGALEALHSAGLSVARPLLFDTSGQFLVTDWIEGDTHLAAELLSDAVDQMAVFLAQLHTLDTSLLRIAGLERLDDPLVAVESYLADAEFDDEVRTVLATATLKRNSPVLIHGDYWPGNLLWLDGELRAVIDWEDAALGDPLADLACARVELLCEYNDAVMHDFTRRYLELHPATDPTSLPIWEIYVSASALATMHLWGIDADDEARRRSLTTEFLQDAVRKLAPS